MRVVWMLASLENARDIEGGAGGTETLLRNEVGRKSHGGDPAGRDPS